MKEDISVVQDSKIAMQVINKMANSGRMNFIYIDNRATDIDNRHQFIEPPKKQQPLKLAKINDHREMIPNVIPSNTGHIPSHLLSDLETVIQEFPQPRLSHTIKAIFQIAKSHGSSNKEIGKWLGIERGKTRYWLNKFKIGNKK